LHLVCTLGGLPIAFALTGAKADERETLLDIFATEPGLVFDRPGPTLIGDKNYFGREFEAHRVNKRDLQRTDRPRTAPRPHPGGVTIRVLQRILALTAAIWHNHHTGQPVMRSLTAYAH
jgi:hypothetical protein